MSAEFARTGGTQHMVQLWVDLPKDLKMTPPTYQTILSQDISVHTYSGGYVRVVAGDMQVEGSRHIHGIAHTRSPVHIYDVCTTDIGSISLHIPAGYTTYVLCVHGTGYINDKTVHTGDMVELGHTGDEVCIGYRPIENIRNKKNESEYILKDTYLEKEEGRLVHTKTHVLPENTAEENIRNRENTTLYGRFLVMAGEPLGQDVVQHGPFVMTTHEDIYTAFVDYRSGKMGKIDTEK
jgi:redox-sensitive bicupin YhaK (pirin superfamily)